MRMLIVDREKIADIMQKREMTIAEIRHKAKYHGPALSDSTIYRLVNFGGKASKKSAEALAGLLNCTLYDIISYPETFKEYTTQQVLDTFARALKDANYDVDLEKDWDKDRIRIYLNHEHIGMVEANRKAPFVFQAILRVLIVHLK